MRLILFVSIVFVALSGLFIFTSSGGSAHQSDEELEKRFSTWEDRFYLLLSMCKEDSAFVRIADDFNWIEAIFDTRGRTRNFDPV